MSNSRKTGGEDEERVLSSKDRTGSGGVKIKVDIALIVEEQLNLSYHRSDLEVLYQGRALRLHLQQILTRLTYIPTPPQFLNIV